MNNNDFKPVCMTEEFWANSQFSVARYYGRVKVNGRDRFLPVLKDNQQASDEELMKIYKAL